MPTTRPDAPLGLALRPHRYMWFGFLENLDTTQRIPIGRLLGVRVAVTPTAWLQPLIFYGLGLALTFLPARLPLGTPLGDRAADALAFMVAVLIANAVHAVGHIVSGRIAGSAMDLLLVTATRDANLYDGDQAGIPGWVHIARASGGPLANLAVAAAAFGTLGALGGGPMPWLERIAGVNLVVGLGGLLPLPSVDGEVIWREVWRMVSGAGGGEERL